MVPDAGVTEPKDIVPLEPLPYDRIPTREAPGVTLTAEWTWSALPAPHTGPEVSLPGIEAARKATRHLWQIDITEAGRMRVVFDSPAFTIARYAELRARQDRYGHMLLWPDGSTYRLVSPGALRALLDERRVDITPLMNERRTPTGKRGTRFSFPTEAVQLATDSGTVVLEQAHAINVGAGGQLLCRTLVELIGAEPSSSVCQPARVPVHAEYTWPGGNKLVFHVASLAIRNEFPLGIFAMPPTAAAFSAAGLPPDASGVFVTREQLAAFRTRAVEPSPDDKGDKADSAAPPEGAMVINHSDVLRYLLIDGVPVAWVRPHGEQYLLGTTKGRYSVQWRTFLGTEIGKPTTVRFPAKLVFGDSPDAKQN